MGGWTEYDMVLAESRMFDKRIYTDAMIAEAIGPSRSKKRPIRSGLIWALTTSATQIVGKTRTSGTDAGLAPSSSAIAG